MFTYITIFVLSVKIASKHIVNLLNNFLNSAKVSHIEGCPQEKSCRPMNIARLCCIFNYKAYKARRATMRCLFTAYDSNSCGTYYSLYSGSFLHDWRSILFCNDIPIPSWLYFSLGGKDEMQSVSSHFQWNQCQWNQLGFFWVQRYEPYQLDFDQAVFLLTTLISQGK